MTNARTGDDGSRMTMRLGQVRADRVTDDGNSVVAWGPSREVSSDRTPGAMWSMRYPECKCPAPDCPDRAGGSAPISVPGASSSRSVRNAAGVSA
ncbi:hypothetical protein GCM10009801_46510 [Streptomyces albiaxialis]|uniref:Uncharacterized protein n=1 Tax=Streptomyces albiaxialis TaxID=329523 RepID=A0ABN2W6G6_9ACTN